MARNLQTKTNVKPADSEFPLGRIKDNPGDGTGTPLDEEIYGDFHQFFARLFQLSAMTYNGEPENAYDGYQYNEAFDIVSRPFLVTYNISGTENLATTVFTAGNYKKYKTAFLTTNSGTATVTLPPLSSVLDGTTFFCACGGTAKATIVADAADAITSNLPIELETYGQDYVILIADKGSGAWNVHAYRRTREVSGTSLANFVTSGSTIEDIPGATFTATGGKRYKVTLNGFVAFSDAAANVEGGRVSIYNSTSSTLLMYADAWIDNASAGDYRIPVSVSYITSVLAAGTVIKGTLQRASAGATNVNLYNGYWMIEEI